MICFAGRFEAHPSVRKLHEQYPVRYVFTGMGPANAERTVASVLVQGGVEFVLSCGFAGGLNPGFETGCALYWADHARLRAALARAGARRGEFITVDRVVSTPAEKALLRLHTGADAVDMESLAIGMVCRARHVPFGILRGVLDPARTALPEALSWFVTGSGRIRPVYGVIQLMRDPELVMMLPALIRRCALARRRLGLVIGEFLRHWYCSG